MKLLEATEDATLEGLRSDLVLLTVLTPVSEVLLELPLREATDETVLAGSVD